MNNFLLACYKDFYARIWFDEESEKWIGRVLDVEDLIVFDGKTLEEVLATYHSGIEELLKALDGITYKKRSNPQVLNLIRHGIEDPNFEEATRNFLNEE